MGIKETLGYIHSVKWQGSKPGLERTKELLKKLGNPEKKLKFVHVAGTNGKGSTSAFIASVLKSAGYKTGLYISPYIECFNERIQVNGEFITDDDLERLTDEIKPVADKMVDSPTEFEIITAIAMKYYLNKSCDIVVLEVGMGGRLDSTNVIETPELAVITLIGYDHVKELGPTIFDIAREKAGIIKHGGDVVIYDGNQTVEEVFDRIARERNAKLHKVNLSRITNQIFSLQNIKMNFDPYGEIQLPLVGTYQPNNAVLAVTGLEVLREKGYNISDDAIKTGLASVSWPGRFEVLGQNPVFVIDGAHNPQCMEATAASLRQHFAGDDENEKLKVIFIVAVMADKDVDAMIGYIAPIAKAFITVAPDNPRSMKSQELAEKLKDFGVPVIDCGQVKAGVIKALEMADVSDIICALGTLYFLNDVKVSYGEKHHK